MNGFKSAFAPKIDAMLEYRLARGFKNQYYLGRLRRFDEFCLNHYPDENMLTARVVYDWLDTETIISPKMLSEYACTIRQFGLYLAAIDEEAFVLTEKFSTSRNRNIPFNFTDDELTMLFSAIDRLSEDKNEPFINTIAPTLFRLTYTCGLRPNESRELLCDSVDLKTGVVTILNTKKHKDRIVVMSDDMRKMCVRYNTKRAIFGGDSPYFFPSKSGGALKSDKIQAVLTKAWTSAVCTKDNPLPPRIRVYDLRHRFASACLNRWLDDKLDLMSMLPYLREYMGHGSLNETAYYIHILPENLLKSPGVDWDAFGSMFPEVAK